MCRVIRLKGQEITTIGELVCAIGKDKIRLHPDAEDERLQKYSNICLCGVDLEGTAKAVGCIVLGEQGDVVFSFETESG